MNCGNAMRVLSLFLLMAGCERSEQLKVTYISDPPGGVLYKQNGEVWGPCPKVLWYDLSKGVVKDGYIHVEGLAVRWPNGLESRSESLLRITVNGTDQQVVFTQPATLGTATHPERLGYRRY